MKTKISKSLYKVATSSIGEVIIGIAFGKLSKLLPVKKIEETKKVLAFWHPQPSWEKHIVIVPKKAIKGITSLKNEDLPFISECLELGGKIAKNLNWDEKRYSIIAHGGTAQTVNQLHFHLNSGELLK